MGIVIPIPEDDIYDYIPIGGGTVQVGTSLLSLWSVQGEVDNIFEPPTNWGFLMVTVNPDGTLSAGVAVFPGDPGGMLDNWFERAAIWKRAAKLADGESLTASDGSKWIYAVGEDGKMVCYAPGSTFAQGNRRFRGHLLTDPKDLWICDDPEWDWLPIVDGSEVSLGDTITFLASFAGVVDEIAVTNHGSYTTHSFQDASDAPLGLYYEYEGNPNRSRLPRRRRTSGVTIVNIWTFFERKPKPADETQFAAIDGSRWIYTDDVYFCWGPGSQYRAGAVFRRGGIEGRLTPI